MPASAKTRLKANQTGAPRAPTMRGIRHAGLGLGLGLGLALLAGLAWGKGIEVRSIAAYLEDNVYYLDASLRIELSEEAERALRHGIALEILTEFELFAERRWLWDKKISATTLRHRLEHRPLTGDYRSVDLSTGQRLGYNNLAAALQGIGAIRKMALFEAALLARRARCYARLRAYVDLGALPAPMRPGAYFSSAWDLAGPWRTWEIAR